MTDYLETGPIRIDTSFTRPHSGGREFLAEPVSRDRYSRHSSQAPSRVRDVTWISTSQLQLPSTHTHTPQTPRYVPPGGFQQARTPTPVLRKSAPTITESELDAEYMTVSVDDRNDCDYQGNGHGHGYGFNEVMPTAANEKSEKKNNFVGGFVNGLRRLPKVMSKSRLRDHGKPDRQAMGGATAAATFESGGTPLPRYTGSPMLGVATSNSDDIPTVERLETSPRASSVSPRPRHGHPGDSDVSIGDVGRRERLMLSAVREHSFEQLHPSLLHPPRAHSRSDDDTSSSGRPPFEREGELPNAMSTPILANASIRSPILAEPRPSADFMKMDSPIRAPPAESVRSQIARAGKFIRDLNSLPWIASSGVSSIYVPGEATKRRYSRSMTKNKGSWYSSREKQLDLFAGPSTTGLLPAQQPHPSGPGQLAPVVPAPFILGSSANLLFSQPVHAGGGGGGSGSSPSHEGPPSTDSHGSQAQVLAPAYVAQPLFVYPSGLPQPGGPPEAQLPRPVYMFANSPPHFMSSGQVDAGGGGLGPRLFVPQQSGLRTPAFG